MTPATSAFPEAELRALLAAAVAAWASAEVASAGDEPRRVYVDAFAGAELQFGAGARREAWEPLRAEAVLRALDGAPDGRTPTALFVEEDPAHLQRIYADLEDLAGERLRATRDYATLAPGEASLVEAPFAAVADEVARYATGARAFFWLAPATARALPWAALRQLLALPDATLLIRFPHTDFEKQSRHTGPLADLPGFARRIVEGCSAFLGDEKHAWLPAWRADARFSPEAALAGVIERFRARLEEASSGRVVRPVELLSDDGARTWCFLVAAEELEVRSGEASRAVELVAEAQPPAEPDTEPSPRPKRKARAKPKRAAAIEVEQVPPPAPEEPEPAVSETLDLFPDVFVEPEPRPKPARTSRRGKIAADEGAYSFFLTEDTEVTGDPKDPQ